VLPFWSLCSALVVTARELLLGVLSEIGVGGLRGGVNDVCTVAVPECELCCGGAPQCAALHMLWAHAKVWMLIGHLFLLDSGTADGLLDACFGAARWSLFPPVFRRVATSIMCHIWCCGQALELLRSAAGDCSGAVAA
jgi:hypothetical protein